MAPRPGPDASPRIAALLAGVGLALHGLDAWLPTIGAGGGWRIVGSLGWLAWAGAARAGLGENGCVGAAKHGRHDPAGPRVSRFGGWISTLGIVALGEALRLVSSASTPAVVEASVSVALKSTPIAAVVAFAIAPALGEELFFRGPLLRGLARRNGPSLAWALSTAAFAFVHPQHVLSAAVFGAALAALALATGRTREAVAAHMLHNLLGLRLLAA